jgi:hypothetical protein
MEAQLSLVRENLKDRSSIARRLRHEASKTLLREPLVWVRHRGMTSKDIFLASYPRSTNTWLRFPLFGILVGKSLRFEPVNEALPGIGMHRLALG